MKAKAAKLVLLAVLLAWATGCRSTGTVPGRVELDPPDNYRGFHVWVSVGDQAVAPNGVVVLAPGASPDVVIRFDLANALREDAFVLADAGNREYRWAQGGASHLVAKSGLRWYAHRSGTRTTGVAPPHFRDDAVLSVEDRLTRLPDSPQAIQVRYVLSVSYYLVGDTRCYHKDLPFEFTLVGRGTGPPAPGDDSAGNPDEEW